MQLTHIAVIGNHYEGLLRQATVNRCVLIAVLMLFVALPAFGQVSSEFRMCSDSAQTQTDIDNCASEELDRAEAELDDKFQRLLAVAKAVPQATNKIKAMQTAWINYRDFSVEAKYPNEDKRFYGRIYATSEALYKTRLTRLQSSAIDMILEDYKIK